jgi:TetR/AcrR family transcriptional repressor of nem operon
MSRNPNPETREKLLDAAEALMIAKGYAATTVDDVCESAGLTKGSFFHYFESKNQVAVEALKRFYARAKEEMAAAPFRRHPEPLPRVYGYLDHMIEMSRGPKAERGCLLGILAQELADIDEDIRKVCGKCFADWAQFLTADLEQAKSQHAPRARWKPETLADHCIAVLEGALVLARTRQDGQVVTENLMHLRRYITLLFEGPR